MWNPIKITRSLYHLFTTYGETGIQGYNVDTIGEDRLDHVITLYRELRIPFTIHMVRRLRESENGRNVLWGRKYNDRKYVEEVVLKKLTDIDYLDSLAPNTVGAHYANLVRTFGLEDIYNLRYKPEERRESAFFGWQDEMRENTSRHFLLSHDVWHTLLRYDTSPIGEAMIQVYTSRFAKWWTPHIVGFGGTVKEIKKNKNLDVWKVYTEALRQSKQVDTSLGLLSPIALLEEDIEEVRARFNIPVPVEYAKYAAKYPDHVKLDTFHPEYRDVAWETVKEEAI